MIKRGLFIVILCIFISISIYIVSKVFIYHEDSTDMRYENFQTTYKDDKVSDKNNYYFSDEISLDNLERKTSITVKTNFNQMIFENMTIVALGDSLTEGIGDAFNKGGFVSVLDRTINQDKSIATFLNYGKLGEESTHLLKRIGNPNVQTSIKKADIVVMTVGANDIIRVVKQNFTELTFDVFTREREQFEGKLETLLKEIRKLNHGVKIYVIGLYNPFEELFGDIPELDQIIIDWNVGSEQITEQMDRVTFIPVKDIFSTHTNLFAQDHFHPNGRGYVKIAERILDYMMKTEEKRDED